MVDVCLLMPYATQQKIALEIPGKMNLHPVVSEYVNALAFSIHYIMPMGVFPFYRSLVRKMYF